MPLFGAGGQTYNVIDSRQAYLQRLLKQALYTMGHRARGGTVDPLLVRDGRPLARDRARAGVRHRQADEGRAFVEVSGRKGLGVKADDLIDRLIDKAAPGGRQAQRRPAGRRAAADRRADCGRGAALLPRSSSRAPRSSSSTSTRR